MRKFLAISLLSYLSISTSHAGLWGLTHHSRANCFGFNETVTWWANHTFAAHVVSDHYPTGRVNKNSNVYHTIDLGKQQGFRHAAYHPTESYDGNYRVIGFHYMYVKGREVEVQRDIVTDCDIYDGWWD